MLSPAFPKTLKIYSAVIKEARILATVLPTKIVAKTKLGSLSHSSNNLALFFPLSTKCLVFKCPKEVNTVSDAENITESIKQITTPRGSIQLSDELSKLF